MNRENIVCTFSSFCYVSQSFHSFLLIFVFEIQAKCTCMHFHAHFRLCPLFLLNAAYLVSQNNSQKNLIFTPPLKTQIRKYNLEMSNELLSLNSRRSRIFVFEHALIGWMRSAKNNPYIWKFLIDWSFGAYATPAMLMSCIFNLIDKMSRVERHILYTHMHCKTHAATLTLGSSCNLLDNETPVHK